ncbi:MAG: hypothetical protein R3B99_00140 [Polyangiales bacterium]|nr:hypothetical protein [Myxococcales bacterium]MCB9599440.1 hypothetical protein [Sandaracinus sp.]
MQREDIARRIEERARALDAGTLTRRDLDRWIEGVRRSARFELVEEQRLMDVLVGDESSDGVCVFVAIVVDGGGHAELWYGSALREPLVRHFDEAESTDATASMAFVAGLARTFEGPFEDG